LSPVTATSARLVSAPPQRPAQDPAGIGCQLPHQRDQQAADLRHAQRHQQLGHFCALSRPRAHRHRPGPHDRQNGKGNHRQRDVPIPRLVAADLVVVQPGLALAGLEAGLDGLITNGKFCCTRRVRLRLTWWHRPLRLRGSGLETDAVLVGAPHDPDLDCLPPAQPPPRRRPPLGSGLPAAGALDGRTMRRHRIGGADGTGGA
jgi:hypothetical protein